VEHPATGEVLESQEDFQRALRELEQQMEPFYKVRRALRAGMADAWEPAAMPEPRYRTETQARVMRCPRCGGKLEREEAP
jgi:hypothetical protein